MKKTIYLLVICAVTVFCIVFGSLHFAGGFTGLAFNNPFKPADKENSGAASGQEILLENFNCIDVDANLMGITIIPGDGSKAKVNFSNEKLIPEISVRDGVVKVRQPNVKTRLGGNNKCELVITVPRNVDLETLYVDLEVGSVELENLVANKVTVNTDVGSVELKDVNFMELDSIVNVGSIDVRVNDKINDYSINAAAELGSVDVNRESKKKEYNKTGTNGKQITVTTNVGSIKLR